MNHLDKLFKSFIDNIEEDIKNLRSFLRKETSHICFKLRDKLNDLEQAVVDLSKEYHELKRKHKDDNTKG